MHVCSDALINTSTLYQPITYIGVCAQNVVTDGMQTEAFGSHWFTFIAHIFLGNMLFKVV